MSEPTTNPTETTKDEGRDASSGLRAMLRRGNLGPDDLKSFEENLRKEPIDRAADLVSDAWTSLPKELKQAVVSWKWDGRAADRRARACLRLGAAVVGPDPKFAGGLVNIGLKPLMGGTTAGDRNGPPKSGVKGDLRVGLRKILEERWLQPPGSEPVKQLTYSHISRDVRGVFDTLMLEVATQTPTTAASARPVRELLIEWMEGQSANEKTPEGQHAAEAFLRKLRGQADIPVGAASLSSAAITRPRPGDVPAPTGSVSGTAAGGPPRPDATNTPPLPHPKAVITEAIRSIQNEVKRWSAEEGGELPELRKRVATLDQELQQRTAQRVALTESLEIIRNRMEEAERRLGEMTDQRNRALTSVDRLENELRSLRQEVDARRAEAQQLTSRVETLGRDLEKSREDKRRDVEYTREAERAAVAQELARGAKIHLENMKELLTLDPSETQRAAVRSCYEELTKLLRTATSRPNG
ncbi:MAG: hypothetical protein ACKVU4_04905 [Phycisphaerales bacterium]